MQFKYEIGFLGFGNMAKAIASSITKKIVKKDNICIYDNHLKTKNNYDGIKCVNSIDYLISNTRILFLCIKPQSFSKELKNSIKETKAEIVVSIMAGIKSEPIKNVFTNKKIEIIRVMPNTPVLIEEGMSVIQSDNININTLNYIKELFASMGEVETVGEDLFHAVTAISGSGPAYVMYFLKTLLNSAISLGLNEKQARNLVMQTFKGTIDMISSLDLNIDNAISTVTSKGGTTEQALLKFKELSLDKSINEAIKSCYNRSIQLSKFND